MRILSRIGLILLVSYLLPINSHASEIPGFEKSVHINATNESVHQVINTLFAQVGVPVKIESNINGMINGRFNGTAAEVFNRISKTYNVHVYYSRAVAYVYKADQISERIFPMSSLKAGALIKLAHHMNLLDDHNEIYPIKGAGIEVVGNQRFIKKIEELALNLNVADKTKKTKPVKTPGKSREMAFREFRLMYASVDDATMTVGDRDVNIPGVATLLRQFIDQDIAPAELDSATDSGSAPIIKTKSGRSELEPRILIHRHTNSIWIEDKAERMPVYQSIIDTVDQPPQMVEIEATVIDINNTRQKELGINWRLTDDGNEVLFGNGTFQDQLLNPNTQITPQGAGGFVSTVLGNRTQFISRINALEDLGAARVVSTPHIITLSNVEALLGSAREFSVRLEGRNAVALKDISYGTILRATPRVIGNGTGDGIALNITIEDGTTTGGSVDDIPERERSVVVSQTVVQNGQSLLIGGLTRETSKDFTSKVPFLGDIPLLGNAFKSNRRDTTITERLFLITPRIVGESIKLGPVLQGDAMDIVDSSDRRRHRLRDEVKAKSERQINEIKGTEPPDTVVLQDESVTQAERESIKRLLNVPTVPAPAPAEETMEVVLHEVVTDQWRSIKH